MKGFIVFILFVIVIVFFIILVNTFESTMHNIEWKENVHVVQSGETLWEISKKYCPESVDCREWIDAVKKLNNKNSSRIYEGECIIVLVPV